MCIPCNLPWPTAIDFNHQSPAQKGPHSDKASEYANTHESRFEGNGLHNIRSNQHLKAQQQRPANAPLVTVIQLRFPSLKQKVKCRPDDADNDNHDAKDINSEADC